MIGIDTAQLAGHGMPKPATSRVARTFCPERPVVSTVMLGVPWPLVILPAEMVQLRLGRMPGAGVPPLMLAVKVTGAFSLPASGHVMLTVGQTGRGGGGGGGGGQSRTTIEMDENATQLRS